jgi:hypothetical protein
MRYIVSWLILALLLGACSPGGTISPVVEQAAPPSPTVHIDVGEQVSATAQPTVAPTSAPPATAVPTQHAQDDKPTAESQAPAATRKEVVWHSIQFQYDPQRFRFAETAPNDGQVYAAASLVETPNPCLNEIGTDCTPGDVHLRLYSRDGLDFWAWRAQQQIMTSYSPQGDFVDLVIAGRPAVAWPGDGIFFGSYGVYAVSIGEDVLLISGVGLEWFLNGLQLEQPTAETLAVGQIAMTTPDRAWDLWSDAVGGARIDERPRLYGGALVNILATETQAVQVRTSEGLTGWIQAAAADALTTPVAPVGDQAHFMAYSQARIAEGYTIPLRESPRSTAATQVQPAKSGQELMVMGLRGDWLRVFIPEVGEGWVRWHYDGAQYIEVVES